MDADQQLKNLLPIEEEAFHAPYARYYSRKRQNFLESLKVFRGVWDCLQLLSDVWEREMSDLETVLDQYHLLPKMLFSAAHARFLTAIELGFSCCIGDCYSILRDGIESISHAHKIFAEPQMTSVWAEKLNGKSEEEAYDQVFTYNKKKNLYPDKHGLEKLHFYYGKFCELATHSSVVSLGKGFKDASTGTNIRWEFHYFETNQARLALFLFTLLEVSAYMEEVFYACFEPRLTLDHELVSMRQKFIKLKEEQRHYLKTTYKVEDMK